MAHDQVIQFYWTWKHLKVIHMGEVRHHPRYIIIADMMSTVETPTNIRYHIRIRDDRRRTSSEISSSNILPDTQPE